MGKVAKVPQVMQMEALECGAACLTMILAYHGRWEPLEKIRSDCGVSRDGSKAVNILKAARSYGLEGHGATYSTEFLKKKGAFPCIVFWNFNHFVVLDGFSGNNAVINDPARGIIKMPVEEFDESFTGIVLEFKKTDAFEEGGKKPDTLRFAWERLEGLGGAIAFVMLTAAITSIVSIVDTALGQVFMDRILTGKNPDWIGPLANIMLLLAAVTSVVSIMNAVHLMRIQGKIAVVSSSRFMRHLLHLPMGFYSQRMVGDLQQRQSANETIAFQLIGKLAPVLISMLMLVLYLIIMLNYSVLLTAVGLLTALINVLLARHISNRRVNISRAATSNTGKLYAVTMSGIDMVETIKATGAENGFFARWAGYQAEVNDATVRTARLNNYLGSIPGFMTQLANIAVLALGIWLIVEGAFTPGALLAFTGFLASFTAPLNNLITLGQTLQEMQTQMERVEDVMSYEPDVPEDPPTPLDTSTCDLSKLDGTIDLENVSFGYSPLEPALIEDFNLHIEPGQWIALVGGSGCGKSTISRLVSGLYEPWSGEVRFDGTPIKDVPHQKLRGSLSVVGQDPVAFDGTVAENVRLWDNSIGDKDVVTACRDADIHDIIVSREGSYSSRILPGGSNFSGGQLQRIEIARALAKNPSIIILDEATSALDAKTEAYVMERIRNRGITCIVVAHRLSTIRDCDEIIVLDDGSVVERGTHNELMAADGAYAELVRSN